MSGGGWKRFILPVLALAGLAIALAVALRGQPDRSLAPAEVLPPVAPASLAAGRVAGAGLVEPASELVELSPLVPGVVRQLLVSPGDRVTRGQLLLLIDSADVQARAGEARAAIGAAERAVAAAEVERDAARRQLALIQSLADPDAVARSQRLEREDVLKAAEARLGVARADLARARAALVSAETELERRALRAPMAGEILQVRTRPGQYVTAGPAPGGNQSPPITMGETRPLHVRIDIDETEIGRVNLGAPATVSPRGQALAQVEASFVRMEPLVVPKRQLTNQASERVDVRVLQLVYALPESARSFTVGQQVDAFLPAREAPAAPAAPAAPPSP
jgi:multidrug efflux pump subunit AcrA (membrane-fusion protein)